MKIKDRIAMLAKRHQELDRIIASEQHQTHPDDMLIKNLKRRKLRLKDKLAELDQRCA